MNDYGVITYSGPLFSGYPRDLEISAKGEKRGFFIVEFDEESHDIKSCEDLTFIQLDLASYLYLSFQADHKNSNELYDEIKAKIEEKSVLDEIEGRIIILKVKGELSGGKTSDINFYEIRKHLKGEGAIHVSINHHGLVSREFVGVKVKGETNEEIEENLFLENIDNIKVPLEELNNKKGAQLASRLLKVIRQNPKPNEKKSDYTNRILKESLDVLGFEDDLFNK